jgi:Carboxypeptidase regulatory-like domain
VSRYVAICILGILPFCLPAQEVTGSITGSVTDPTGGAVVKASVTLTSEATSAVRTVFTDAEGNFIFTAVNPGIYTVLAEQAGFRKLEQKGIELVVGDKLSLGALKLQAELCPTVSLRSFETRRFRAEVA